MLSLQFETEDGADTVDAIENLNPMAVASVLPLEGAALDAVAAAGIAQIHRGSAIGCFGRTEPDRRRNGADRLTANPTNVWPSHDPR
ncbi:hypothetical protein IU483_35070 [Streptomyces gardneri]|nr:hypothetical protein [Streptomyces gardneri]